MRDLTFENKWEEIVDMLEVRLNAFGVASQEKILATRGLRNEELLKTCEMYDTSTNQWQLVASLNDPRYYGSMVRLKVKLYILGEGMKEAKLN